jgi:hypothetical protein
VVAALDALRELDLLRGGEERNLPDVLQEELERVGRDLGLDRVELRRFGLRLRVAGGDDRYLRLVEGGVELVELRGLEVELVQRQSNLVGVEPARLQAGLEQTLCFVAREDVLDRCSSRRALRFCCQYRPPWLVGGSHGSRPGGRRQSPRQAAQDRALRIVSR